jgi:3-oxoadipate enol-lactonase
MNFTTVSSVTIHYRQEGPPDGPPLVFINSLGTDLRIWDGVLSPLAGRYRIARYDQRGHGLSDCPPGPYTTGALSAELAGMLDVLEIDRATLVGISVGGQIAVDFAATRPERVQALVLCDTAPVIGTAGMWNERITAARQHGMAHLAETILSRWFAPGYRETQPAAYRGYANMLVRTPVEGYTATCEAIRDADLTGPATKITAPALILCGAEDRATPPDLVRGWCDRIPQAQFQLIPAAGHLPCIEQPAETAGQIAQFCDHHV